MELLPDHHRQHHLHDGPGLNLPVSVGQPARHLGYQTNRSLAIFQPGLPLHHHTGQRDAADGGGDWRDNHLVLVCFRLQSQGGWEEQGEDEIYISYSEIIF